MALRILIIAMCVIMLAACKPAPPADSNRTQSKRSASQSTTNAQPEQAEQKGMGKIEVKSKPAGATIVLIPEAEGAKPQGYGETPATIEVPAGEYNLTLELRGYAAPAKKITVEQNKTTSVNIVMKKR